MQQCIAHHDCGSVLTFVQSHGVPRLLHRQELVQRLACLDLVVQAWFRVQQTVQQRTGNGEQLATRDAIADSGVLRTAQKDHKQIEMNDSNREMTFANPMKSRVTRSRHLPGRNSSGYRQCHAAYERNKHSTHSVVLGLHDDVRDAD